MRLVGTCPCFLPTRFVVDAIRRPSLDTGRDNRRRTAMRIEESQGSNEDRTAERPRAAGEISADRRADSRRNPRLLPRDPDGRIHLRAAGGQRRQAGVAVARRRQDHDRHARQGPRLSRRAPARFDRSGRPAVTGRQTAERRGRRQRRRAAGLPILRQPPEIPAVRLDLQREDRGRPTASRSSSAICSRRRRRCASSMPASATAPCCRG